MSIFGQAISATALIVRLHLLATNYRPTLNGDAGGEVRMAGTPAELATDPAFIESFLGGTVPR